MKTIKPALRMNTRALSLETKSSSQYSRGMEQLIGVVQELSLARDLEAIMAVVRRAARELTGADGASFVLRDRDSCFYADEDAIAPLWKGHRFPMSACISGWVMLHREPAVIEDIYADPRIPVDAYRPTFVKSLVMVPIRTLEPVGAIGNYWATRHRPGTDEVRLLQALADSTAVAMENVRVSAELWQRQAELAQLQRLNTVDEMASVLAHEVNQPLTAVAAYSAAALQALRVGPGDTKQLCEQLQQISLQTQRAAEVIRHLRRFLRQGETERTPVDANALVRDTLPLIEPAAKARGIRIRLELAEGLEPVVVDRLQIEQVMLNLFHNGIEAMADAGLIGTLTVRTTSDTDGHIRITVADDGPGLGEEQRSRLFQPFMTTKAHGLGVGLAISRNIVEAHGGKLWAEAHVPAGAVFQFTLPLAA